MRGDLAILHMNRPKNKVHLVSFDVTSVFLWSGGAVSRSERSVNLYQVVEPQSVLSTRVKFVCQKKLKGKTRTHACSVKGPRQNCGKQVN